MKSLNYVTVREIYAQSLNKTNINLKYIRNWNQVALWLNQKASLTDLKIIISRFENERK